MGDDVVRVFGYEFKVRRWEPPNPYARYLFETEGLKTLVGPCAPNIDAWRLMMEARVRDGKLAQEVFDELLSKTRKMQVEALEKAVGSPPEEGTEGKVDEQNGKAEKAEEIADKEVSKVINAFARDPEGYLVIEERAVRACLRECLTEALVFSNSPGGRERFRQSLGLFGSPFRILRDGKPLTVADDIVSKPCTVRTSQGPRTSIKIREEIKTPWNLIFGVQLCPFRENLTIEMVVNACALMPTVGIGAERSQGYGGLKLVAWGLDESSAPVNPAPPKKEKPEKAEKAKKPKKSE